MKITAVIMAGGKGERFWPRSRTNYPKQFLSLTEDGLTMIQLTVKRLLPMIDYEDMFIVTNEAYLKVLKEQLPEIPAENILAEPVAKNTAPAVGLAASVISKKYKDAVMLVLPSDHLIKYEQMFLDTLTYASEIAKENRNLVTIGITPTYPETGYGYINFGHIEENETKAYPGVYSVKRFVEKPDLETAKEYLSSGAYLWNSGMFVWKISTIMDCFKQFLPDMYEGLQEIRKAIGSENYGETLLKCFNEFKPESIDYGIMEKADNIYTIPGNFGWDDVGSWLALERINKTNDQGNLVQGDVLTVETKNTIVIGDKKLIAAVGLEDLVIVDTPDAILICDKDHSNSIKKVIENLKICNRNELL